MENLQIIFELFLITMLGVKNERKCEKKNFKKLLL